MREIFSLLLSICALAVLAKTTLAQELPSGHMVDHLDVIPGDPSYLTIRGVFDESLFSAIQVKSGDTPGKFEVSIPQAFLNNVTLPQREMAFAEEDEIFLCSTQNPNILPRIPKIPQKSKKIQKNHRFS